MASSVEELNMSLQTGELIHSIGNRIVDKELTIESKCEQVGEVLQELGSALRTNPITDRYYPCLERFEFKPSNYKRSELIGLADWLFDSGKSFDECVNSLNCP
ncbi:MAG: hypothetical protein V7749_00535 [Cocleimonas sp.]